MTVTCDAWYGQRHWRYESGDVQFAAFDKLAAFAKPVASRRPVTCRERRPKLGVMEHRSDT